MKRIYAILITCIACMLYLTSCIDEEYDLDKDINQNINVGGSYLSLPIGSTEKIVLSELLDIEKDDDEFIKVVNGNYSLSYKDSVEIKDLEIDPVTIPAESYSMGAFNISARKITLPYESTSKVSSASSVTPTTSVSIPLDNISPTEIDISAKIPYEIEQLVTVEMEESPGKRGVLLEVSIIFTGIPQGINEIKLDDFTIKLPNIFVFDETLEKVGDKLVFVSNDVIENVDGEFTFKKQLHLKSFILGEGNEYIVDKTENGIEKRFFELNKEVNITGAIIVSISNPDLESIITSNIKCTPSVSLEEMIFSKVTGIFNPAIDPVNEVFEFDDLPAFFKGDNVNFDFINPIMKFKVSNTLAIPVTASATITPIIAGNPQENNISASLDIKRAQISGEPISSEFWLSEEEDDRKPNNCEYIPCDIGVLIASIPDSLDITVEVEVAKGGELHSIDLTEKYSLKVNYEIDVPLALGKDFKINYSDTIKDIGTDLEEVTDKITSLTLFVEAENSVPLNMSFKLRLMDKDLNEITDNDIEVEVIGKISAGTKDATAQDGSGTKSKISELSVKLTEKTPGALAKMAHLIIDIDADIDGNTVDGVVLNENQYIKLSLDAKIEGGINIDLDE